MDREGWIGPGKGRIREDIPWTGLNGSGRIRVEQKIKNISEDIDREVDEEMDEEVQRHGKEKEYTTYHKGHFLNQRTDDFRGIVQ